jgi:hypothetical protein
MWPYAAERHARKALNVGWHFIVSNASKSIISFLAKEKVEI